MKTVIRSSEVKDAHSLVLLMNRFVCGDFKVIRITLNSDRLVYYNKITCAKFDI